MPRAPTSAPAPARARVAGAGTRATRRGMGESPRGRGRARAGAPSVLVPIATGVEEMETVIIVDVLRRAGARVTIASVGEAGETETWVECSRGVRVAADARLRDVAETETFDMIALPGGMPGATNLAKCAVLTRALERQLERKKTVAAMCASPGVVLAPRGFLDGRACTAHPAFVKDLPSDASAEGRVVIDGDVITSRGPGTAIEFALALVERLFGAEKAREVAGPMVLPQHADRTRVANEWRLDDATVLESGS